MRPKTCASLALWFGLGGRRLHAARPDLAYAQREMASGRCAGGVVVYRAVHGRDDGSALSGLMIERFGVFRLIAGGYAVTAAGVACLGVSSWGIGLLSVFSSGFALGLTGPTVNLLVAEINSDRSAGSEALAMSLISNAYRDCAHFGFALLTRREICRKISQNLSPAGVTSPFVARPMPTNWVSVRPANDR